MSDGVFGEVTSSGEGVSFAVNTEIPDLQISWVQFSSSSILNRDFPGIGVCKRYTRNKIAVLEWDIS